MPLTEDRRKQLDGIVSQMVANGETDDSIQFVVNDFKSKYSGAAQPKSNPFPLRLPPLPFMGTGLTNFIMDGINETVGGAIDASRGKTGDDKMGGASRAVRGAGTLMAPAALPAALISAPIATVGGGLLGMAGSMAAEEAAKRAGLGPGAQSLAGDGGGLLGGMLGNRMVPKVGRLLRGQAEGLAEAALNTKPEQRAFGKTPGIAMLDETKGLRPEQIAKSAQDAMGSLSQELMSVTSGKPASIAPVLAEVDSQINAARNVPSLKAPLEAVRSYIANYGSKVNTADEMVNFKRDFRKEFLARRWAPDAPTDLNSILRGIYRSIDGVVDAAEPKAAGINQRLSSLVAVKEGANRTGRMAPGAQLAANKFKAATGGLLGTVAGYAGFGPMGAVLGTAGPIVATDPGVLAGAARGLNVGARLSKNKLPAWMLGPVSIQKSEGKKK